MKIYRLDGSESGLKTAVIERRYIGGSRDAIFTHPTIGEGLNGLFASMPPR